MKIDFKAKRRAKRAQEEYQRILKRKKLKVFNASSYQNFNFKLIGLHLPSDDTIGDSCLY